MHLKALRFLAWFFGALSSMFVLGSLGSDYWLLVSESCDQGDAAVFRLWRVTEDVTQTQRDGIYLTEKKLLFYHEGLFWRCSYQKSSNEEQESMLAFLDHAKGVLVCYFVLGATSVMIGGFVTICATSRTSHRLYEAGGALFITGGVFVLSVVLLFAVWMQVSDSLERYGLQRRRSVCPSLQLSVHYGPSFMLASIAAFLCLLTGLFLLLISSVSRASTRNAVKQTLSMREECV